MNNEKSESMDDFNKKESLINGKTLKFALRIIEMVKDVRRKDNENGLKKQVLRAGTSIGASVREAE